MNVLLPLYLAVGAGAKSSVEVDRLFYFILAITVFFFVLTQGLLIYFALKYRKKSEDAPDRETPYITHNNVLETTWIVVPTILLMIVFFYGTNVFDDITRPIPGATEIHVTASQWMWRFEYADGRKATNELRVVVNKPTRLIMTSTDVIHSFYVPDFRLKNDVVPGRYTDVWFTPTSEGTYTILCAEYCGLGHSKMEAKLIVMSQSAYDAWLKGGSAPAQGESLTERGQTLVKDSGCLSCHSVDGSIVLGPSFKGIYGRTEQLEGGASITVDDNYLMESVIDPQAKVVKGFQPIMPSFKGTLSTDDVKAVIEYMKTLK